MKVKKLKPFMGIIIRLRGSKYQVDFGTRDGKRKQRSYSTLEDAHRAIREHKAATSELDRLQAIDEKNKRLGLHNLTDAQRIQVMTAIECLADRTTIDAAASEYVMAADKLEGSGSIIEAVEYYLKHTRPKGGAITLSALLDEYVKSKQRANRRPRTIGDVLSKPGRFVREFPDMLVHEVAQPMLESWMDREGYKGVTREDWRRAFKSFFGYAVKTDHAADNPAAAIDKVGVDETVPEILSPSEAKAVLQAAEKYCADMVPHFAVGFFGGLRAAELHTLKWSDIDLQRRRITVRPETAKKRRQRYVEISDNLAAWIAPHAKQRGDVYYCRYRFDALRKRAGIRWPRNAMRHAFASYFLAVSNDAPKTARQLGHAGDTTAVLFAHYAELVTPEEAAEYWGIMPTRAVGVIQFAG